MATILGGLLSCVSRAHGQPAPAAPSPTVPETVLPPVTVTAPPPVASSSEQMIPGRDFELRPQGRPADVLRLIPGLIINQHQGGGKAEQYLIRGFDADHGTDLAIFVDGVPVNLRSHAHGQGYADLHFLIPETVRAVDVLKGPYFAEYGDFDTAGVVRLITRDYVDENTLEVAGGSFNTQRYLALLSPTRDALKTFVAMEGYRNDGPFDHPNGYLRFNVFAKASTDLTEDMRLSVWASFYHAEWHGSGEVPARAVRAGLIDRFGSIDPNEGGITQRATVNADYVWKVADNQRLSVNTYVSYYTLTLFNDFTFFLNDPDNGDMLNQRDRRFVAGFDAQYEMRQRPFGIPLTTTAGIQYRIDTPHVVLANAVQRHQVSRVQDVDVVEQSYSPFVKFDIVPVDKVRLVTGVRGDVFAFDVKDRVNTTEARVAGTATKARPGVKANLVLGPWAETELFGNFGTGFHSNDARAVIANPRLDALPTATAYEVGLRSRLLPRAEVFATYWFLDLDSELVFVGDEGTTEARGRSHREGVEAGAKVRLLDWLTFTGDVTYTARAEFVDTGQAIPLAPIWTARADLTARLPWGLSTSLEMRHLGDRWADEARHHTARGYTLFNWTGRYRYRNLEAFLSIENLANTEWREAQFLFTSRLPGEPAGGVEDVHFTPGTPRSFLGGVAFHF
ncbi:MAG TPA: TonB-dependent receptor plug domain-containing protein [Methylomirabilota bacterium]|nr:TonB-dependent receptor plug domain-containing protein [Methylomirabilota bacterium]